MPSQKNLPILALLMIVLIIIIGILITGFFAFSPLSYVQLNIAIKAWCMFINGLLWMSLVWTTHLIEMEGTRRLRTSYLKEICSEMGKVAKFFYLPVVLLKTVMTVIGTSILIISTLELRSLGAGKVQIWVIVGISIFLTLTCLFLILRELSSVRK